MQKLLIGVVVAAVCLALPCFAQDADPQQDGEGDGTITQSSDAATATTAESVEAPRKNISDSATSTLTRNVLLQREQAVRTKRFGLLVAISTFAGSATFLDNQELRQQRDYVAQVFDFRPTFGFNVGSHRLRLSGRLAFETEYTQPNSDTGRRWKPFDTSLAIADDTLYKEPLTGILFNGAFRLVFPTSYESINVRKQWLAMGLSAGARKLLGPVQLSFNTSVTKYFNGSKTAVRTLDTPREGDTTDDARPRGADPVDINSGYANNSWLFANTVGVTWLATDRLAVSYGIGLLAFFRYAITDERDALTSPYADAGVGNSQRFQSSLEVSYDLTHYTKDQWSLPFGLTVALGASAVTPVQQDDNEGWIAPLIVNAFTDRAANNYGTIYLDLVGIY